MELTNKILPEEAVSYRKEKSKENSKSRKKIMSGLEQEPCMLEVFYLKIEEEICLKMS